MMNKDHGYDFDNPILSESPEGQSLIDSFDDGDSDDATFWLEQELLSDYDPDLHHTLYEEEEVYDNLSAELRIDEFVARVADATDSECRQISDLLDNLETGRLRYWLPRLRRKPWTGHSLLLFLQFREVWDKKDAWWESTYWDKLMEVWYPVWNRGNLSLDDTYILIHNRIHCKPEAVIDNNWLEEWNSMHLWLNGYFSFASYAVFKSRSL